MNMYCTACSLQYIVGLFKIWTTESPGAKLLNSGLEENNDHEQMGYNSGRCLLQIQETLTKGEIVEHARLLLLQMTLPVTKP